MMKALRCKLQMFGVPVDGPTNLFCDDGPMSFVMMERSVQTQQILNQPCQRSIMALLTVAAKRRLLQGPS
jgi:hypothetical protein